MRVAVAIAICLATSGCQHPKPAHLPQNPESPAYLRIQNQTGSKVLGVVFQKNLFGDVEAGGLTEYQEAARVPTRGDFTLLPGDHQWTEISIRIPDRPNRISYVYVDRAERFVQSPGYWTFVLRLRDKSGGDGKYLDIEVGRDR
jgi:hypothetical protein